jgi:hypothetical protein
MSSSTCNKKFEDKFNYDIVCADDKSQNCRQKINSLVLTQSWRAQNPADGSTPRAGAGQGGLEGFLATCIMNSSETSKARRRSRRLAEYTPTASEIEAYDNLVLNKTACEQKWLLAVSKRLKAAPDIPSSVVTTKTGTLGNFTTGSVADDGYSTIQTAVLNNGWSYLSLETNNKEKKVKLNFIKVKKRESVQKLAYVEQSNCCL